MSLEFNIKMILRNTNDGFSSAEERGITTRRTPEQAENEVRSLFNYLIENHLNVEDSVDLLDNVSGHDIFEEKILMDDILDLLLDYKNHWKSLPEGTFHNVIGTLKKASFFNTERTLPKVMTLFQPYASLEISQSLSLVINNKIDLLKRNKNDEDKVQFVEGQIEFISNDACKEIFLKYGGLDLTRAVRMVKNYCDYLYDHFNDDEEQLNNLTDKYSELYLACKNLDSFDNINIIMSGIYTAVYTEEVMLGFNKFYDVIKPYINDPHFDSALVIYSNSNFLDRAKCFEALNKYKDNSNFDPYLYTKYMNKLNIYINSNFEDDTPLKFVNELAALYGIVSNIIQIPGIPLYSDDENKLGSYIGKTVNEILELSETDKQKENNVICWARDVVRLIKEDPELFKHNFMQTYCGVGA